MKGALYVTPRAHCLRCSDYRPFHLTKMFYGRRFGLPGYWGALRCTECLLNIAWIMMTERGRYGLRRIAEAHSRPAGHPLAVPWFYCQFCEAVRILHATVMMRDKGFPLNGVWGQLLCQHCNTFVTAIRVDEPGQYGFVKLRAGQPKRRGVVHREAWRILS